MLDLLSPVVDNYVTVKTILTKLRIAYRFVLFLVIITGFIFSGALIHWSEKNPSKRRRKFAKNTTRVCRKIIQVFNISVLHKNKPDDRSEFLYVGNHLGFIDILCLASVQPVLFVTSQEMRKTPLLGLITEMAGCTYVDRRNRRNIHSEQKAIANILQEGHRVVLYPEATSTNGESVLPFKGTLMMAAAISGRALQPGVFNVISVNDEKFSMKWRDSVCWHGDMSFLTALLNALAIRKLVVEFEYLKQVHIHHEESRAEVAKKVHEMVSKSYNPVIKETVSEVRPYDL